MTQFISFNDAPIRKALEGSSSNAELIQLYREYLQINEAKILEKHHSHAGGLEVCENRAEMMDSLISTIFQIALKNQNIEISPISVVAVGGYGRGALNPGSDIDLLFLLPTASKSLSESIKNLIQDMLYPLWDLGFKLGHASRSIPESISQACEDPQNLTALMDSRLLAGNIQLFENLLETFEKQCLGKKQNLFFESRRMELRSRHKKSSYTVFLQEPNVKESCGGLRDYQNILWIARIKMGAKVLGKLVSEGVITENTLLEINEAYDFLMRVRNELHYHAGISTDILTLQLQGVVATSFDYPQKSILRRTEAFMRDYYRHTRHIYNHATSLMETFQIQKEANADSGIRSFLSLRRKKTEIFDGFIANEGRIYPVHEGIFKEDEHRLMRLFQHCQLRNLRLSPPIRRLVANHWNDIDRTFRYDKANRETFQAILERKGDVARTLRQMHRIGFIGRYMPEFGALDCLVQHEFFHRYTADEHTLRCIDQLDKLVDESDPKVEIFRRLFHEILDPYALYLALLLHDTGRSENVREHIDGSTMLASKVCSRLQIRGARRSLIMFLVDNHLMFWRTATTKNLEDPAVIAEFAAIMKTPENLDALLLFTYCDTNGTAPDAWNGWKESLMLQLHKATRRFLYEGKEKFTNTLHAERASLLEEVKVLLPKQYSAEIQKHFDRTPSAAFAYREANFISQQILAITEFGTKEHGADRNKAFNIHWIDHPDKGYSELILVTRNRPQLLEKLCCVLASLEINILSADLFTRSDEIVVNIFRVCTVDFEPISHEAARTQCLSTFTQIFEASTYDAATYLKRKVNFLRPRKETGLSVPVRAHVSNSLHPFCTTIEIQALDRIGLLHDLFHTINEANLDTTHARICTEKGVAMDTLYVTTSSGEKVEDSATLQQLKDKIDLLISRKET